MELFHALLPVLPEGKVLQVEIGLHWTAVLVEVGERQSCGLAATCVSPGHDNNGNLTVKKAGKLEEYSTRQLADLVLSENLTEVSVGVAAINALLPRPLNLVNLPAEEYIAQHGNQSRVAMIGHFPFVNTLRPMLRNLWVIELTPQEGDLPASAAPEVIPQADILAITSTTLINRTFDDIMQYRKPGATVMLLGPSTPLSPLLFEFGVHVLSGSLIDHPETVLPLVRQGANFRPIKSRGIRLVTLEKSSNPETSL